MELGKMPIIIGHTWLEKHNLIINWQKGDVKMTRCPQECGTGYSKQKKKKAHTQGVSNMTDEISDNFDI
jgi:hypothetical protein